MRISILAAATAAVQSLCVFAGPGQPYSTWMADSLIANDAAGDSKTGRDYQSAVFDRGLIMVYNKTGNVTYTDHFVSNVSSWLTDAGELIDYNATYFSLDDTRIGTILLWLYANVPAEQERWKTAMDILRNQLDRQPRTASGGFWHRSSYPNQMWLDGIFMAEPFYAQYTASFEPGNTTAWDDITRQFDLIEEHCRNATTHLLVHGYDESKVAVWADPVTGAAPMVWDRALGWYAMALLDVLDWLPVSHEGNAKLKTYFTTLAEGLKSAQDESGGWWLIMNEGYEGREGNYIESSGTAMFTYALLKGIRVGLLEEANYFAAAEKAYTLMTEKFAVMNGTALNGTALNWEGTVVVGSLGSNGTYEYYISQAIDENDFKGAGPFIYAAYEYELATAAANATASGKSTKARRWL